MAETGVSERGRWLAAALVAGLLSALTVVVALAAPRYFIPRTATNLSNSPTWSSFADIAISPDGDRMAVVWPEAYEVGEASPYGSVRLSWASESAASGWSSPVYVFTDTQRGCATWATVAVTGTMAHVAYIVQSPCTGSTEQAIYYQTYEIGGALGVSHTITNTTLEGNVGFVKVDVALDAQGNPHFVYVYYRFEEVDVGTVYYQGFSGGSPGAPEQVSGDNARNPAIAWSDGYIHAVWEDLTEGEPQILYRRRPGDEDWERDTINLTDNRGNDVDRPRNPDVAACGGQVVVAWDWEWPYPGPDQYALAYAARHMGGEWVVAREVGTDKSFRYSLPEQIQTYTSTDAIEYEYIQFLRPTVAIDEEGKPTVVWHVNRGGVTKDDWDYDIMYIQAQSMTVSGITWLTPTLLNRNTQGQSGSAVVALAPITSSLLHVAYLHHEIQALGYGDWETYCTGIAVYGEHPFDIFLPVIVRNHGAPTLLNHTSAYTVLPADHPAGLHRWKGGGRR